MDFSPGVITREFDDSFYNASGGSIIAGFLGTAHKGPEDTPTLLSAPSEYVATFGEPTTQGGYAAMNFLRRNGWLYYVRVGDSNAAESTVTITAAAANIFTATANSTGTWGDDIDVQVAAADSSVVTDCNIYVYFQNVLVERLTDVGSFTELEALASDYVTFAQVALAVWPVTWASDYATYSLTGGDSGTAAIADGDYTGITAVNPTTPATGLHCFDNKDEYELDLIACPGYYAPAVATAGLTLAGATRQDCLYLPDMPDSLSVDDVIDWHNGVYGGGPTTAWNTSYGATFYPWLTYYDEYTNADVYAAPSGIAAAIMAYSWSVRNPYVSPAGVTRGKHDWATGMRFRPSEPEIAKGYSRAGQNVNFFRYLPNNIGIRLWCQKTLQRTTTALDRINTRVTLNLAQRRLRAAALEYVHEPNDAATWSAIESRAKSILDPIKGDRGIRDYLVICDATVNTPAVISRNELRARIMVQPMTTAEWLVFDWVLVSQDATL